MNLLTEGMRVGPKAKTEPKNTITVGWQVNRGLDPEYWIRHAPRVGHHSASDAVEFPAAAVGHHTVVVAQSGSGKSFFLGRLIEEILLNTKARCLVLDPNGDFSRVEEVADPAMWEGARYIPDKRAGFLPTESREKFEALWSPIPKEVRSRTNFELPWSAVSPGFLNADLSPVLAGEVYQCHRFVQEVAELAVGKAITEGKAVNLLVEAEEVMKQQRETAVVDVQRALLEKRYQIPALVDHLLQRRLDEVVRRFRTLFPEKPVNTLNLEFLREQIHRPFVDESVERALESCVRLPRYISQNAANIYFGRAQQFQSLFSFLIRPPGTDEGDAVVPRLEVVDLTSIGEVELRRLAISSLLGREFERLRVAWDQATAGVSDQDVRVPTFVVVDEAHNLIPAGEVDRTRAVLREQFRTIAAEGRKFGFLLILLSQRPDKLDSLVVSECENRAVMRIGSQSVLDVTRTMLGLDDIPVKLLEKTLDFETGRILLYGPWAPGGPTICYGAARRTKEGGRNLRPEHWAKP